jgi:hypothetical protein
MYHRSMPFRGHDGKVLEAYVDPLARFFELEAAFDAERGFLGDHVPLRLVAANLVLCQGEPTEIASRVRELTEQLRQRLPFFSQVSSSLQLLTAAVIMQRGDQVDALLREVERVRGMMRELGMRRMEVYEFVAVLAMRIRGGLAPIEASRVQRLHDIHAQMKRHHWWLTGPEDYPACAFLAGQDRSPEDIAARANAVYEGLHTRANAWRGDPLQTASNMLALSPLDPDELVDRFVTLATELDAAGIRIGQGQYDEVAVLCFLAQPARRIVEAVVDYTAQIRERLSWTTKSIAFGLACNLAFVRLLGNDPELGAVADAKSLLDMQTIIAARQAGAAAGAAGAT